MDVMAEYFYNTGFQSAIEMTPFEAVYGRPTPTVKWFLPREIRVAVVAEELKL